jgi:oligoendopeptidase F
MSDAPPTNSSPTPRELDAFRDEADSFIRDLDEEYYLHFAGLKETLDVEQVYERYEELTKLETAQKLKDAPTELWRFACEGFLGNLTREHQARVAKEEAELEATVDGETIPYRMLRVAMSNEPDRDKRQRLEEARLRLLDEHLNPIYLDAVQIDQEAVRRLDAPNYYELYKRFGFRLDEVAAECQEVLDETERLWEREGDKLFRSRLGIGLDDARPWDVVRLFRAPELDLLYPNDQMLPALEHTLTDLGIDLRSQENVHLDLDARPSKSPRAFCAPIDVPGKVMLVIQPIGGKDDWEALFHEAGHTEHYANTNGDLPMEARRLGDMAVTEGWAMLMQHLVTEPAWLNRRLDVPRVEELAHDGAVSLLYFVRRYAAKLLYEIEFFQAESIPSMRNRYAEILGDSLKLPVNPESYLDDIDGSFYVTGYLRSWAFEAQLREFLRSELGNDWFAKRDAGDLLRELWSLGQGPTADQLLKDVTGAKLEMASVAERIREGLVS